ncbi:MAG: rRNA maturation RNase YbeY [Mycoplasmataceae bacterium]|nr:rRNA maturation RNase YbeY [Mycoplasmataceae bacterium]
MVTFQLNSTNKKQDSIYLPLFDKICNEITKTLKIKGKKIFEVNFITSSKIKTLNNKYRHINKATDVLSFPLNHNELIGEIFIATDFAKKEAKLHNWTMKYEICLLFTHGLLHLLGWDHDTKTKENKMFALQDKIVANVIN